MSSQYNIYNYNHTVPFACLNVYAQNFPSGCQFTVGPTGIGYTAALSQQIATWSGTNPSGAYFTDTYSYGGYTETQQTFLNQISNFRQWIAQGVSLWQLGLYSPSWGTSLVLQDMTNSNAVIQFGTGAPAASMTMNSSGLFNFKYNATFGTPSSGAQAALPSGAHGFAFDESSTAGVPAAGVDYIRADSTTHTLRASVNGGAEASVLTGPLTASQIPAPSYTVSSGSITVTGNNSYVTCTTTCTVTPPAPAAGIQLCVDNAPGSATVITLAALGSGNYYSLTANTGWGTANHTVASGGAVTDSECIVGYDGNHYKIKSYNGTWTD